ncbi:MAG: DUF86 domain-containing protein [Prochlorotrichaceae cyanobacterium]
MSSRSLQQRLQDILEQAEEILTFADGLDYDAFCADTKTVKAVLYDLAVIGEAARSLLPDIQAVYPELPWEEMRAMRNLIVHEYFRVNLRIAWTTINEDLSPLIEQIRELIEKV